MSYKEGGWKQKYVVSKADGSEVDPEAVYFVLRLDEDPHACAAALCYADSVEHDNQEFAEDIRRRVEHHRPEHEGVAITVSTAFEVHVRSLGAAANRIARDHGFSAGSTPEGTLIALMHSELSEALEALREGNGPSTKIPAFSAVEAEFADVFIRMVDFCHERHLNLGGAVKAKMEYNKGRSYKHGGKEF